MCHPARCRRCGKASWTGCGQHVDQVLRGVAADQRCACPPAERPRSVLRRLLGRRG